MKLKFSIIFFFITISVFFILNYEKNQKISQYLKNQSKQYNIMYNITYQHFKDKANIIFDTTINNNKVVNIYTKLQTATPKQKRQLREDLYNLLKDKYTILQYTKLQQLHFHLSTNESFLRFHKPKIYGDNLTEYRETINFANKNNKYTDGFEVGKIISGYRFVFPINDKNNVHLGSVEVSFKIDAFTSEFTDKFEVLSSFYISKSIISDKVWQEKIKSNYKQSVFENYYIEQASLDILGAIYKAQINQLKEDKSSVKTISNNLKLNQTTSIFSQKLNKIITTIPIFHPLTKEKIAFINIRHDGDYIENKIANSIFTFFIIIFFVFVILVLTYKNLINQKNVTNTLENAILKKAKELEESNSTLERRIHQEVQKNREKDIILFQQTKMASMGEMIGNIAHQWRQPLAIINTIIAILNEKNQRDKIDKITLEKKLIEIENKTLYMSQTIEDFLSFFKPSKTKKEFTLIDIIDNSVLIIEQLLSKNNIRLKIDMKDNLNIHGFKDEFIQVILAIITNSIQAFKNQDNKFIAIDAIKNDTNIIINIRDNAGGIPKEILHKVFEPYFTTKHKSQGTGLGLYMSKMICENNMNGILSVSNIQNGVKFTINLKL